ncbi:MAG: helix-turn-helix domain-containing protein, partial [Clostridiaceae bacterium]|nr:helix-turn-helix domain-containing protein [Clostridiaceae bacterium]
MASAQPLELPETDRIYLESVTRTRTMQAQTVSRAKILLLKAGAETVDAIADKLDLNRNSVLLCLKKYQEGGVEHALNDAPGRGRN